MNNFKGNLVIIEGSKGSGITMSNVAQMMDNMNKNNELCSIVIKTTNVYTKITGYKCKRTNKMCVFNGINHENNKYICDEYKEYLGGN